VSRQWRSSTPSSVAGSFELRFGEFIARYLRKRVRLMCHTSSF
jgi:hypothetical protein